MSFGTLDSGGGFYASWNWPAFFLSSAWVLYRKMYAVFFILFGIGIIWAIINIALSLGFLYHLFSVALMIGCGIYGNAPITGTRRKRLRRRRPRDPMWRHCCPISNLKAVCMSG